MNFIDISNVNELCETLRATSINGHKNFAILKITSDNYKLKQEYIERINNHNSQFMSNKLPDSGFDVLVPKDIHITSPYISNFIDMEIKTEMFYCDVNQELPYNTAFNSHPRSSISKTPLMLANHTGIIDAGYRGNLIGAFRLLPDQDNNTNYHIKEYTRLLQICHPTLCPIYVMSVDNNQLSVSERGANGFGSTK